MNDLTHSIQVPLGEGPLTMSSLEIAELTGKRHDHVMRDIRVMIESLGGLPNCGDTHRNPQNGQEYPIFRLPKRECIILVSGYDVNMRARIVDRWMELEATPKLLVDLNDPAFLRGTLLSYTEKVIALQHKVDELQPKVEAHDRLAEAYGTFCRTTAAKNLGIPPHALCKWMRTNGWTYRRPGDKDDLAYQSKIVAGYLEHKVTTGQRPDGTEWSSTQVRISAKGMLALAKAFPPAAK